MFLSYYLSLPDPLPSAHMSNECWIEIGNFFFNMHVIAGLGLDYQCGWCVLHGDVLLSNIEARACRSALDWSRFLILACYARYLLSDTQILSRFISYSPIAQSPWYHGPLNSRRVQSPSLFYETFGKTNRDIATRVDVPSRVKYWSEKEETNQWFLGPIPCLWAATAIIETCTSTLLSDWWNLSRMSMAPFPLV